MSSIGLTIPRPKKLAHTLFAMALAKYGFSGEVTHSATVGGYSALHVRRGESPCSNRAFTVLPSESGMTADLLADAALAASFSATFGLALTFGLILAFALI